jgi:hypothetical protein
MGGSFTGMPTSCSHARSLADVRSRDRAAACPIERSTVGTCGHSRTARYTGSLANRQADPLRKPTCDEATGQSLNPSELHGVRMVAVSRLAEWTI